MTLPSWLESPALHMAALGALAFAVVAWRDGVGTGERPRVVVPPHRLELRLETFAVDNQRLPTAEESQQLLDGLIDDEVLYQYALALGMHEEPAAQRRLAKIAEFVEANPHKTPSEAERAAAAIDLGLHHGDLVVRRILVDGARRLIRAVVLLQEPRPELVEEYFEAHRDELARPPKQRIAQVMVNGFKWPDTEARARELLTRILEDDLDVDDALALGDEFFLPATLPALTEKALATKIGPDFAAEVMTLPAGEWAGPIASRYGHHLVYVQERIEAEVPPLEEVHDQVKGRLLRKLADEWLALRLKELRHEFEMVTPVLPS